MTEYSQPFEKDRKIIVKEVNADPRGIYIETDKQIREWERTVEELLIDIHKQSYNNKNIRFVVDNSHVINAINKMFADFKRQKTTLDTGIYRFIPGNRHNDE